MNKNLEILQKELDSFEFKEESIYEFTKAALLALPDYFWEPTESGAENGIITHTKTAMSFANSLLEMEKYKSQFNEFSRNQIRSAILLHDGLIYLDGSEHKIQPEHPCGIKLPYIFGGKALTKQKAEVLFAAGRTPILDNLVSKKKKPFRAYFQIIGSQVEFFFPKRED